MTPAVLIAAATLGPPGAAGFSSHQVIAMADRLAVQQKSCGPISAYFLAKRYGITTRYADFASGVTVDEKGVSLDDVDHLLTRAGLDCRVVRATPDDLGRLTTPCVVVIRPSHCVVLDELDAAAGTARIFEPASRKMQSVSLDALRKSWTGDAVVVGSSRPKTVVLAGAAACLGGVLVLGAFRFAARRTPPGGRPDAIAP